MENTYHIISIFIAIISLILIFVIGVSTDLLRESELKGKKAPYSFSRFQIWSWTLVIAPAFSLHWGYHYAVEPIPSPPIPIPPIINFTSLVLLGISAGVVVTALVISSVQIKTDGNNPGIKLKAKRESVNFLVDILTDDSGNFSIPRLQNLIFTLIYIVIYVSTFFITNMNYPEFDNTAFVLMGISSGTYIFGKSAHC